MFITVFAQSVLFWHRVGGLLVLRVLKYVGNKTKDEVTRLVYTTKE